MGEHDAIINNAKSEGYVVPPTDSLMGKAAIEVGGKGGTKAAMEIRNQEVTNKIARREAGLRENEPITESNLAAARDTLAQPYRDLAQMSPAAGQLWDEVRQVRSDAKLQWKHYNRSQDPSAMKAAQQLDQRAQQLEQQIDGIAQLNFTPDALQNLRNARTELAKNFMVDRANTPGGNVDAKQIYRDYKARSGGGITGGLKTIAEFEVERRPHFGVDMAELSDIHTGGGSILVVVCICRIAVAPALLWGPVFHSLVVQRDNLPCLT